jgi:hypothetical protein
MSTAPTKHKQEHSGQEQPRPAPIVSGRNLEQLQGMMNAVFLMSGRFIKEHQSGGGTGRQKINLRSTVPIVAERFQDALDELESEVRLAQTVLRRDLALLKQDRKKREIAAKEKEAEKARRAAESRTLGSAVKTEEVRVEKVSTPAAPEPAQQEPQMQAEPEKALERSDEKVPPPIEIPTTQTTERDPLFDGTPTTADPQGNDFDFDAMFGDAMDTTGDNNTAQDDVMDTSADMGFDFGDGDGDGPSLLRGLEDFAKSGEDSNTPQNATNTPQNAPNVDVDMTMGDLPDMIAPAEPPAQPKPAEVPTPQPVAEVANNNTTAATNNGTATNDAAADDDLMGGMVTDNLDDLFDMDEYGNPENSSFDDAFFNFGE